MTIAVDFDGTIVEHKYPEIGKELPFAIATLRKLSEGGHKIILWTVREGKLLDQAVEFCRSRGLEFYAVNSEYPDASWSGKGVSRKVAADMYIDDRNLGGVPDWNMIYQMITCHLSYQDMLERMSADSDGDEPVIYNGTFKERRHHHHRGFLGRLADRCREARYRYRH